ncbi:MAG TPA: CpaF family protein, partial [Acidimicrobiales bacterium]|nr:CpaF family protein [Acidimicrobiales bacterium]
MRDEVGIIDPRADAMEAIRDRVHRRVIAELGPVFYNNLVDQKELRARVDRIVQNALKSEKTPMSLAETTQMAQLVGDEILGHGPIERLVHDPTVSEIMVNGPDSVYVERSGRIEATRISFVNEAHLRHVIGRIVGAVGRHIDEHSPMVDARLADGSRVNAVFPPLSIGGPFLTIRKFETDPFTLDDLIHFGTVTPELGELLRACVQGKTNIMVSGGAGTGKTTLLNVMSTFIPSTERIITIEDAKELQLRQDHVLSLEYRPPNTEGQGEVTIRDLLRNTLRMRPDRIIIGECRAGEALDMLQAMNTGHDGSITTIHSNGPRDTLS